MTCRVRFFMDLYYREMYEGLGTYVRRCDVMVLWWRGFEGREGVWKGEKAWAWGWCGKLRFLYVNRKIGVL